MEITSITAAFTSLKLIGDAVKGLIGLHTDAEVRAAVYDIQEKLLSAQQEIFAINSAQTVMADRIRYLEKQIADMEAWETQKQRYQMARPYSGSIVYALKKSMATGEPPHYLCASCYNKGKASILQDAPSKRRSSDYAFTCPTCGSEALNGYSGPCDAKFAEDIQSQ